MSEVKAQWPQPPFRNGSPSSPAVAVPLRGGPVPSTVLRLAELVPLIRARVGIGKALSDDAILLSLAEIERHRSLGDRWSAAFSSELGRALAARRENLGSTLGTVLTMLSSRTLD